MAFCQRFMPDAMFESCLSEQPIYRNPGLTRIFFAAEDKARGSERHLDINGLVELTRSRVTAEHIFPQEPSFALDYYGFESMEQYVTNIDRLGNLAPLEKSINSACQNITIENKMNGDKYYRASDFMTIHNLATSQGHKNPAFSLDVINARGAQLAKFCVDAWPICKSVAIG